MTHVPTKEQEKAFKSVIRAIKKAKKLGLNFYAQQWWLVAFTNEAVEYINKDLSGCYDSGTVHNGDVPNLSESVISDSGADDTIHYRSIEDKEKFNPDNL